MIVCKIESLGCCIIQSTFRALVGYFGFIGLKLRVEEWLFLILRKVIAGEVAYMVTLVRMGEVLRRSLE